MEHQPTPWTIMYALDKLLPKKVFGGLSKQSMRFLGTNTEWAPNDEDVRRLLAFNAERGFPGMLGSIDCMHWHWKNCPTAWQGMYTRHVHKPTIILEAVASHDLWICHSFFGLPGSLNDINVLDWSPIFRELVVGRSLVANYSINGNDYTTGYYLADGIYPKWSTFVKTIPIPRGLKQQFFAKAQESARKDVERAFGVLQSRFAIVRGPAQFWDLETIRSIMNACVILHNKIVEDQRGSNYVLDCDRLQKVPKIKISREPTNEFMEFLQVHRRIRNRKNHTQLQADIIEHLWEIHGRE